MHSWGCLSSGRLGPLPADESEMGRPGSVPQRMVPVTLARALSSDLMDFCAVKSSRCNKGNYVWNTQKAHVLGKIFTCHCYSPQALFNARRLILNGASELCTCGPSHPEPPSWSTSCFEHTFSEQFPPLQSSRSRSEMNVLVGGRHRRKNGQIRERAQYQWRGEQGAAGSGQRVGREGVLVLGEARQPQSCDLWPFGTWSGVEAGSL